MYNSDSLTVLKGSFAVLEPRPSFEKHSYFALRKELIDTKVLEEADGFYVFISDYTFSSPSAAAAIVVGGAVDGPSKWKDIHGNKVGQLSSGTTKEAIKNSIEPSQYHDFFAQIASDLEQNYKSQLGDISTSNHKTKNYLQLRYPGFGYNHFELRYLRRGPEGPSFEIALHRERQEYDGKLKATFADELPKLSEQLGESVLCEPWGKKWERLYYLSLVPPGGLTDSVASDMSKRMAEFISAIEPYFADLLEK
jgi:hypothetical protein